MQNENELLFQTKYLRLEHAFDEMAFTDYKGCVRVIGT